MLICRLPPPPVPFSRGSVRGWAHRVVFSPGVGSTFPRPPSLRAGLDRLPSATAVCFGPRWPRSLLSFPGGSSHPPPAPGVSAPAPRDGPEGGPARPSRRHRPSPGNVGCARPPGMALAARPPKSPATAPATLDALQLCFLLDKAITNCLSSLPRLGRTVAKGQSYFSLQVQFSVTSIFVT